MCICSGTACRQPLTGPSHPDDVSDHSAFARDKHLTWLIADKCQGEISLEPEMLHKGFVEFYVTVAAKEQKKQRFGLHWDGDVLVSLRRR